MSRFLRFIYTQIFLRFSGQIRDPYLVRVDRIYPDQETNGLTVSFHIANKRIEEYMPVAQFVAKDMIYMVDPKVVFEMGQHFGAYSEKLLTTQVKTSLKNKCITGLKRVFIDE